MLDATCGYWQVKLDKKSSLQTTFNTPFGRYRFTRVQFGVNSAQGVFQKVVDLTYEGLSGVVTIVDDILVYGNNRKCHATRLDTVLCRTRERVNTLNPDKCVFQTHQIAYFGNLLSVDGLRPDLVKIQGIRDMPPSTKREELETILGMATYQGKFAANLSAITAPLRFLTKGEQVHIGRSEGEGLHRHETVVVQTTRPSSRLPRPPERRFPTVRRFAEGSWSCLAAGAKTLIIHIKVYDQRGLDLRANRKRAARGGVCVRTISAIHIQE